MKKKPTFQLTDVLLKDVIKKLEAGIASGEETVSIPKNDAEKLIQALEISVSIEKLLDVIGTLPQQTLMTRHKEIYGHEDKPYSGEGSITPRTVRRNQESQKGNES